MKSVTASSGKHSYDGFSTKNASGNSWQYQFDLCYYLLDYSYQQNLENKHQFFHNNFNTHGEVKKRVWDHWTISPQWPKSKESEESKYWICKTTTAWKTLRQQSQIQGYSAQASVQWKPRREIGTGILWSHWSHPVWNSSQGLHYKGVYFSGKNT